MITVYFDFMNIYGNKKVWIRDGQDVSRHLDKGDPTTTVPTITISNHVSYTVIYYVGDDLFVQIGYCRVMLDTLTP